MDYAGYDGEVRMNIRNFRVPGLLVIFIRKILQRRKAIFPKNEEGETMIDVQEINRIVHETGRACSQVISDDEGVPEELGPG